MGNVTRRLFEVVWDAQERLILWLWRVQDVGGPEGFFRVRVVQHRGDDIVLRDGTTVRPGDAIGELHIRNEALRQLHAEADTSYHASFAGREAVARGMRQLAAAAAEPGGPHSRLAAFFGETIIALPGRRFGFEVRPERRGVCAAVVALYQRLLTARNHPLGAARLRSSRRRYVPREVWISRARLLVLYGPASEHLGDEGEPEAPVSQCLDEVGES